MRHPPLTSATVNEQFLLARGPCMIDWDGGSTEGRGDIILDLRARGPVLLEAEVNHPLQVGDSPRLLFTDIDFEAGCIVKRQTVPEPMASQEGVVEAILPEGGFDRGGDAANVGFHLANFILEPQSLSSDLTIQVDDWQVTIERAITGGSDLEDGLRNGTGHRYGITHHGRLEKTDGRPITKDEALDFLDCLAAFLSFIRGYRCGPLLPWGCDYDGLLLWQELLGTGVESWKNVPRWTKAVDDGTWSAAFSSFYDLVKDHEEYLGRLVSMYCTANYTSRLETALIISQATLEGMAAEILVDQVVNQDDFKKLTAQGKMELLLSHFGIPSKIPAALRAQQDIGEWVEGQMDNLSEVSSGPESVTRLRNAILHIDKKKLSGDLAALEIGSQIEILSLALQYVELALLAWMDYEGQFWDRVEGGVKPVPWA